MRKCNTWKWHNDVAKTYTWPLLCQITASRRESNEPEDTLRNVPYPDKEFFHLKTVMILFLFHHENICCGYSLEVPQWDASNEYPQYMFSWRNKKNFMRIPPHIWSYDVLSDYITGGRNQDLPRFLWCKRAKSNTITKNIAFYPSLHLLLDFLRPLKQRQHPR